MPFLIRLRLISFYLFLLFLYKIPLIKNSLFFIFQTKADKFYLFEYIKSEKKTIAQNNIMSRHFPLKIKDSTLQPNLRNCF